MTELKEKPIHEHDCDSCFYLGRWMSEFYVPGEEVDLWICPNSKPFGWTPIVRFGKYGDYASGSCFIVTCSDLREAAKRGVEAGHITQEQYDKVYDENKERLEA